MRTRFPYVTIILCIILINCMMTLFMSRKTVAITYEYDSLNRLLRVDYQNGNVIEYTYDAVGNRTSSVIIGTIIPEDTCILYVAPVNRYMSWTQGANTFQIDNRGTGDMSWTSEVINGLGWLMITSGSSGVNNGIITFSVAENLDTMPRVGMIRIEAPRAINNPTNVWISQSAYDQSLFTDVSIMLPSVVGPSIGASWADYDGDHDLDIYLSNWTTPNALYRNDGASFSDASASPINDSGRSVGAVWGDYNNDGILDLYIANNSTANRLCRGIGGGKFVDATAGPLGDVEYAYSVAWIDYDNDSWLDLYIVNNRAPNKLLHNNGGSSFTDVTTAPLDNAGSGRGCAWADYDNDGDQDLYVTNCGGVPVALAENVLLRNDGGGVFTNVTHGQLNDSGCGRGAAWGDYDNDGDMDLYLVNYGSANVLFRNDGGVFTNVTNGVEGDAGNGITASWGDYDLDGWLDLYLVNNGPNKLLRNAGNGTFIDVTSAPLGDTGDGGGAAWGDYDNDGDLDLLLANGDDPNKLFRNDRSGDNHWLQVELTGSSSNRAAIGTRLRLVTGTLNQIREVSGGSGYCSQNSLTVAFGMGTALVADSLIIQWPSGMDQILTNISANKRVFITEGEPVTGDEDHNRVPSNCVLHPVFPNPFNPVTTIRFDLPERSRITLQIFDVTGQLVRTLISNQTINAGPHDVMWDGKGDSDQSITSGIYFCRLQIGNKQLVQKMVLIK
jgi:YD repeat-containing protein